MKEMDLLTPVEAAGILGISRQSIYQAIRDGRLPVVRVLGHVGIERQALKSYQPDEQRLNAGRSAAKTKRAQGKQPKTDNGQLAKPARKRKAK